MYLVRTLTTLLSLSVVTVSTLIWLHVGSTGATEDAEHAALAVTEKKCVVPTEDEIYFVGCSGLF